METRGLGSLPFSLQLPASFPCLLSLLATSNLYLIDESSWTVTLRWNLRELYILFYSRLSFHCRKKTSNFLCPLLSLPILFPVAPQCQSLQRLFCLPTDLASFIHHSVLLMVRLLSFIRRCVLPISICIRYVLDCLSLCHSLPNDNVTVEFKAGFAFSSCRSIGLLTSV